MAGAGRRGCGRERSAIETSRGAGPMPELHAAARFGAGVLGARGAGRASASRSRCPPAWSSRRRCTRACCWVRSPCPSTCAWPATSRRASSTAPRSSVAEPLGEAARARRRARERAPRPRRGRRRDPHLRHDRGAAAGGADLRQPAMERDRRGGRAGIGSRERWLCALTLAHVGGLSILVRARSTGSTAIVHERFEVDRVLHDLSARRATGSASSRHARAPARRGAAAARGPALRAHRRWPRARRAAWRARARPASPWR